MLSRRSFFAALLGTIAAPSLITETPAHPGALNSSGCHRVRRTGQRHCHSGAGGRRFVGWGGGVHRWGRRRRRR